MLTGSLWGESGLLGEERGPSIPESSLLLLPGAPGPLGQTSRWPSAPGPTVGGGEFRQGRKGDQRVGGSKVTQSAVSSRPPGFLVQYLVSSPPHSSSLVNPVGQEALALLRGGGGASGKAYGGCGCCVLMMDMSKSNKRRDNAFPGRNSSLSQATEAQEGALRSSGATWGNCVAGVPRDEAAGVTGA